MKKCAVVVYSKHEANPVNLKWKWGEDELPIVGQYTYLGVEISKDCSWDAHIAKVIGKSEAQVGKMDAILTDPHLDTMYSEGCECTNVGECRGSTGREREIFVTTGNSADESS